VKVSVRLQQGLWAFALVLSIVVTQSPMAMGQIQFNLGDQGSSALDEAGSSAVQQPAASPVEAQRALLKARQALAHSDVQTAQAMLDAAKQQAVDFSQIGDSPETVQKMIDRQSQLAELASQKDRSYNAGAASFLLTQAEALVYYQDFETAEMLISQAKKFPVQFNAAIGNPDQLEEMIKVAKSNAAQAQQAVAQVVQPKSSPAVEQSNKPQAMKLLSQAQLAMDQGNWNEAKFFVDEAIALDVPDNQFAADEARPWQYELKIQNALNRQLASNNTPTSIVVPASFEHVEDRSVKGTRANRVVQADYDPATDKTYNTTVAGFGQDANDSNFGQMPKNNAREFYRLGLQAIDSQNPTAARQYMERAWANRDQLDGMTRQSIQDQLARLTISKPAATPVPAALSGGRVDAVQVSAVDPVDPTALQRSEFRKLQSEVFRERANAERKLQSNPREALELMTMLRGRIAQSELNVNSQRPLLTIIDRDLDSMQAYIEENLPEIINDENNTSRKELVEQRRQRRYDVETQVQKLVEKFNDLVDERRYSEARVVARQAADLDPDSEIVALLTEKAKFIQRVAVMEGIRDAKEEGFWSSLAEAEKASIAKANYDIPVSIGDLDRWREKSILRQARAEELQGGSEADRRIWNILKNERIMGDYKGTLAETVDQLSKQANVNIVFDDLALAAEGVRRDQLVDMSISSPISARSVLQLIISSVGLEFVVENEAIKITSAESQKTQLKTKTYYIGDLVMPIVAPQHPMHMTFMQPNVTGGGQPGGVMNVSSGGGPVNQLAMAQQLGGALPGNPFNSGGYNNGPQIGQPTFGSVGGQTFGGVSQLELDCFANSGDSGPDPGST